jgi:hypothetical protein
VPNVTTESFGAVSWKNLMVVIKSPLQAMEFCFTKHLFMKTTFTLQQLPEGYEVCGIGAAPEEDSLIVMSSDAIRKLRAAKRRSGFFAGLFSGPYEITGTGSDPMESDFIDQELVERGIRK